MSLREKNPSPVFYIKVYKKIILYVLNAMFINNIKKRFKFI